MTANDPTHKAAAALVAKLEAVHADRRYIDVFTCAYLLSGAQYTGPTYTAELDALKKQLALKTEPRPSPVTGA